MFPACDVGQMPDMVDNIVDGHCTRLLHVKKAIDEYGHDDATISADAPKHVIWNIA
jgi:hypothetical protein